MIRKSSYSLADCIEAGEFRTSTYSGSDDCIEVGAGIVVQDSKQADRRDRLHFTPAEWHAFTRGVKEHA